MSKFDVLKLAIKERLIYRLTGEVLDLPENTLEEIEYLAEEAMEEYKAKYGHCKGDVYGTKPTQVKELCGFRYWTYNGEEEGNYTFSLLPVTRETWKEMYRLKRISITMGKCDFVSFAANQLSINLKTCPDELYNNLFSWDSHLDAAREAYTHGYNGHLSSFGCP